MYSDLTDVLAEPTTDPTTLLEAAYAMSSLHGEIMQTTITPRASASPVYSLADDFSGTVGDYRLKALLAKMDHDGRAASLVPDSPLVSPENGMSATSSLSAHSAVVKSTYSSKVDDVSVEYESQPVSVQPGLEAPAAVSSEAPPTSPPHQSPPPQILANPRGWSSSEVLAWLKARGYDEESVRYQTFAHHRVTGEELLVLEDEELREMYMLNKLDRQQFLEVLAPLKRQYCPNATLEVCAVELVEAPDADDQPKKSAVLIRRRVDVQHRASRYHRRNNTEHSTALEAQRRAREFREYIRSEGLESVDSETLRLRRVQKILNTSPFHAGLLHHEHDSPRDHARIDPEWTMADLVFWLEHNHFPESVAEAIKKQRLTPESVIQSAKNMDFEVIGLDGVDPTVRDRFRRLCIAPSGLVADEWSSEDVVAWFEVAGQGVAAAYIQANTRNDGGDPIVYMDVCDAARADDAATLSNTFQNAIRLCPLNGRRLRHLAEQTGILECLLRLPEFAIPLADQPNIIRWLRHEPPAGVPTGTWSSNDVLAWFEAHHDTILDLELHGHEVVGVDHSFLLETFGIEGSMRQAEILRTLHHDAIQCDVPSSLWPVMRVWAWCSHRGLALLGEIVLAHQLDGMELLRLSPYAVELLIERLIEETPEAVQRALHLVSNVEDPPHTRAALRCQAIEKAKYVVADEINTFADLQAQGIAADVSAVRDHLGDHPNPEWDVDEVAAWLVVHEVPDAATTATVQQFTTVDTAVWRADNWADGAGLDGSDLLDDPTVAEHLFPPGVADADLELFQLAVAAARERFEPLTPTSQPQDVFAFLRNHRFPRAMQMAEATEISGAALLGMTLADFDREFRVLEKSKRDFRSKSERTAECRRLITLIHTPVWSTSSMSLWTVAQTESWLCHEGFFGLTSRQVDGEVFARLMTGEPGPRLREMLQGSSTDIPSVAELRHAVQSFHDYSKTPALSLAHRLPMYSY